MPSTATTNLTIGTILDLIGPLAQPHSSGKDPSAFDALLQPPAPRETSAPQEREATAHHPSHSHTGSSSQPGRSSTESESAVEDSLPDGQSDDCAPVSASTAEDEESCSTEDENDGHRSEPVPDSATSGDQLVSQSLAGFVAAPVLAVEATPPGAEPPGEADFVEPDASEPAGKSKSNPRRSTLAPVVATAPAPTDVPIESTADSGKTSISDASQVQAAAKDQFATENTAGDDALLRQVVKVAGNDDSDSTAGGELEAEQLSSAEAVPQETNSSGQRQPQDSSHTEQHQTDPRSELTAVQSAEATAPTPTQPNSPAVAALTPAAPIADTAAASTNPTQSSAIAPGGQAQRSRLHAEFLAQPAGAAQRRGVVEVDTTRLLSRVARAFAAAQERDGEVRLRLSPPELGALRLDIRVQDGALVAHLQTETDAARTAIVENLPALRERLAEQGVRIERFEVDLMQRQSSGTSGGMPNQSDGRQGDASPAALRVAAPPRRAVEPAPSSPSPSASLTATDGLNVII